MGKQHFSIIDVLTQMAKDSWGSEFHSLDEAAKDIAGKPDRMAAYGILELINRFNSFTTHMARRVHVGPSSDDGFERPDWVSPMPGVKQGDITFGGSLEEGFQREVVLAVDSDSFAISADLYDEVPDYRPKVRWAVDRFLTLREAVVDAADGDIKHHKKRYEYAMQAKRDAESGGDLSKYLKGMPEDESEDA